MSPAYGALRRAHQFCGIFVKNVGPFSMHEKTSDKPEMRDMLQNTDQYSSKGSRSHRQGQTEELSQIGSN